jgi:hypothetical protein
MTSVLSLPIEKQKEFATKAGKTLEQWLKDEKLFLEKMNNYVADDIATKGQRPEEWTEEMVKKFADKMQSSCEEYP